MNIAILLTCTILNGAPSAGSSSNDPRLRGASTPLRTALEQYEYNYGHFAYLWGAGDDVVVLFIPPCVRQHSDGGATVVIEKELPLGLSFWAFSEPARRTLELGKGRIVLIQRNTESPTCSINVVDASRVSRESISQHDRTTRVIECAAIIKALDALSNKMINAPEIVDFALHAPPVRIDDSLRATEDSAYRPKLPPGAR